MTVRVLFFAHCRDLFSASELVEEIKPGFTLEELANVLIKKNNLRPFQLNSILFSVNEEWAGPQTVLKENDVVAFLPPVAGG